MAKSKNPNAYPLEYAELIRRVDRGQRVTIPFPDKKSAEALRFDLYGYKNALLETESDLRHSAARLIIRLEADIKNWGGGIGGTSCGYLLHLSSQIDEPIAIKLRGIFFDLDEAEGGGEGGKVGEVEPEELKEDTNEQAVYKAFMPKVSQGEEEKG